MVLKFRNVKCILSFPLLMGFAIGILSVYTYYLLLNYEDEKSTPIVFKQETVQVTFNHQDHYHQVDLTNPNKKYNTSLLCLIFIDDIDSLFLQYNVWLNKCGNEKMYVSKKKHMYIDHVITDTYSTNSWQYYCQTLLYLHTKYNSGIIKYDWIFLAKDNVWLIYENLIHLISLLNVNKHKHKYYAGEYVDGILSMNAGVLLSANILSALVQLFNNVDACNTGVHNGESEMLDIYLRKLNNVTPVSNMDSYGCTLFHSISLFKAFNINNLRPEKLKRCMSRSAITFQLDLLPSSNHAMFYKYVLYKIRLVTKENLKSTIDILPTSIEDENIWRVEAFYELNLDSSNMSQTDFFYYWSKKRHIVL